MVNLLENINSTVVAGNDGYLYVGNNPNVSGTVFVTDSNSQQLGAVGAPTGHILVPIKAGMRMIVYDYSVPTVAKFYN